MRLFIPAVGYRIKLTQPWAFELYHEHRNDTLLALIDPTFDTADWSGRYTAPRSGKLRHTPTSLPAETLLEVDRVYVRTANKTAQSDDDDYDSVTFKVVEHPSFPVKKRIRFWAKLADCNNIEYELPPDHTIGKEQAKENAKKPKKLTPDRVKELVNNAIHAADSGRRVSYYGTVPAWFTKDVAKQFKALEVEHNRLREPWEKQRYETEQKRRRAEIEHQLKMGSLSLPIAMADKVKTIDDLISMGLYEHYFQPYEKNHRTRGWTYLVPYVVMASYGEGVGLNARKSWERLPDGTKCRTFRPADARYDYEKDAPSITHLWVKVYSDVNDLEITKVEAGFDEPKEKA